MELEGWVVRPKPHPLLSPAVDSLKWHITLRRITLHEAQEKRRDMTTQCPRTLLPHPPLILHHTIHNTPFTPRSPTPHSPRTAQLIMHGTSLPRAPSHNLPPQPAAALAQSHGGQT